jgi:hypothetical protein
MVSHQDIINRYQEYKTKFPSLPELGDLDHETEFIDWLAEREELPEHFLDHLRRRFTDMLMGWVNYLHSFIHPNQQSMILMHESDNLTPEDKDGVTDILNQIMFISRISTKLELQKSEEANANFLNEQFKHWQKMKQQMIELAEKNIIIWDEAMKKSHQVETADSYVG